MRKKVKKVKSKKRFRLNSKCVITGFFVLLFAGAAVAVYLPLRPTYSEAEKRELTKFPEFSVASLLDGSYFSGISTWYADTFPFRETFIDVNSKIKSYYGVGDTINGFSDEIGDEIPIVDNQQTTEPVTQPTTEEESTTEEKTTAEESTAEQSTAEKTTQDEGTDVSVPTTLRVPLKNPVVQELGSVLVVNNAGYEYYHFVRSIADDYAAAINKASEQLKGTARVFDMIVPTSMDITLDDTVRSNVKASNQNDAINYMYSKISDDVIKVKTFDTLRAHNNEYIYFRTDHHWTALGAYYAYGEYTKAAGIKTARLADFNERKFDNFLGTFYNDSGKNPALEKDPDTVYAWAPKGNVTLKYTDKYGAVNNWKVIYDVSTWSRGTKYNTFVAGDQPYTHIVNPDIKDGSSVLVVKESFGNAMIPFLTENYAEIHVIDYRIWAGDVSDFVKQNGVQDVIFINNISATRNSGLVKEINAII